MLVRRLPLLALLAGLPVLLANCSSDSTSPGASAGAPPAAAGTVGVAGQASNVAGGGSAGAPSSVAGGGSSNVAGGGSSSVAGGGSSNAGSANQAGSSSGGTSGGSNAGAAGSAGKAGAGTGGGSTTGSFALTSPDQAEGAKFDGKFTCNGASLGSGINPELDWSGAPAGTMSFAITFIDTTIGDTKPMGQHWAMWNIPATVMKLPQGTKTLSGDFAMAKQSGAFLAPCAVTVMNNMDDQYEFTVWAIPTATLNVMGTASVANALTALKALTPKPATAVLHGHAGVNGK